MFLSLRSKRVTISPNFQTKTKIYNEKEIMGYLRLLARNWFAFVGPGVMQVYPTYASVRSMESPSSVDDQQWLTYWIIHSFLSLLELSCWKIFQWLPFWPYMKLILCAWLVLPIFNGAAYIYQNFLRKLFSLPAKPSRARPN